MAWLKRSLKTPGALFVVLGCLNTSSANALVVTPVFDSSISQDPNAAAIENSINNAASLYPGLYGDPVNVHIAFVGIHAESSFIAFSETAEFFTSYNDYTGLLSNDALKNPQNQFLPVALANLPSGNGASDPDNTFISASTVDYRALGLNVGSCFNTQGNFVFANGRCAGGIDGLVFLNLDHTSFTRPPPPYTGPGTDLFDAQTSVEHEIDEVLGIGGPGSTINSIYNGFLPSNFLGPMDLYRYCGTNDPSHSIDPNACGGDDAYFSIDGGVTPIQTFNQLFFQFGDAGDWGVDFSALCPDVGLNVRGSRGVQGAFGCPNVANDVTRNSPEDIALQAIGYDPFPNPVPEPMTLTIFGGCLSGLIAIRRRQRTPTRLH